MRAIPRLIASCLRFRVGLALDLIAPATAAQTDQPQVYVAKIDGPITPVMARLYRARNFQGGRSNAAALVIR